MNNKSRDAALSFLQEVLVRNAKRQQLQVQERFVAGDGFMLNFLSVMQHLSSKVKMGQVDVFYLHRYAIVYFLSSQWARIFKKVLAKETCEIK